MADFYELARQFVCMIVAATLSLTVSVVDKMLSQRPEWAEKVALLETQFRAIADGTADNGASTAASAPPAEAANGGPSTAICRGWSTATQDFWSLPSMSKCAD